jgi:hypothetical protein
MPKPQLLQRLCFRNRARRERAFSSDIGRALVFTEHGDFDSALAALDAAQLEMNVADVFATNEDSF